MTTLVSRAAAVLALVYMTLGSAPAMAEWQARPTIDPETSRSALYVRPTLSATDMAQIRLRWSGRASAKSVDYRNATAPLDPATLFASCATSDSSNPPVDENFCRSLSWASARLFIDIIVDLEDEKYAGDPFVGITRLALQNEDRMSELVNARMLRNLETGAVNPFMFHTCYESFQTLARGVDQDCDVLVDPVDRIINRVYNRIAVIHATIPIWTLHDAHKALGGGKLAVHLERRSGTAYAFTYHLDGLPEALFR